jgi:nitrite reductase/ring-hydroxylating ferredoxin subunit
MNTSLHPPSDPIVKQGQMICPQSKLSPGGRAFRFQVLCGEIKSFPGMNADPDDYLPAFIIQYEHHYFAYLNRCAHVSMELDWNPGEIFDEEQQHLICATHYAVYDPQSGQCLRGPCPKGSKLITVPIIVKDDGIYFADSQIERL